MKLFFRKILMVLIYKINRLSLCGTYYSSKNWTQLAPSPMRNQNSSVKYAYLQCQGWKAFSKYLALYSPPQQFYKKVKKKLRPSQITSPRSQGWARFIVRSLYYQFITLSIPPSSCLSGSAETMLFLQETQVSSLLNPFTHTPHTYVQYTSSKDNSASFL